MKTIKKMKKILVLLTMLLSLQIYAGTTSMDVQEKKPVDVELEKGNSSNDDRHPRTLIPIVCTYMDGEVQLTLLEAIGEYSLTVTNQATGEHWSAMNALRLQTSTASGTYFVEIVTGDGTTYYGTYTL